MRKRRGDNEQRICTQQILEIQAECLNPTGNFECKSSKHEKKNENEREKRKKNQMKSRQQHTEPEHQSEWSLELGQRQRWAQLTAHQSMQWIVGALNEIKWNDFNKFHDDELCFYYAPLGS